MLQTEISATWTQNKPFHGRSNDLKLATHENITFKANDFEGIVFIDAIARRVSLSWKCHRARVKDKDVILVFSDRNMGMTVCNDIARLQRRAFIGIVQMAMR